MKKLIIGAILTYDLDYIDASPDDYSVDEIVEMLRIELQDRYEELNLDVEVRDYLVEEDDFSTDW